VVPIRARKAILGTLSIMRSGPGRNYTTDDLMLLEDLASRAGLAIDNARLYRQLEQRVRERTAELEIANAELEAFSYSVAHDLRAPLRAIDGFGHALLDDCGDALDEVGRRHIERIRDGARRMGRLIDDLLGLARVGRMELRRQEVDLTSLATSLFDRLRQEHPARSVLTIVEPGLVAHADPTLLEIVLTNLLGNAWKFTSKRASARIELARASGEAAVFVLRDDGAGFDPAHASKLFGVFERLHTTGEFEGTGIGLAIVERIVKRHGGRVWAEGNVGQGASFFFTLEP
jgi:light-regulated signal transduction histidine kinase (bacteriophytochrome)